MWIAVDGGGTIYLFDKPEYLRLNKDTIYEIENTSNKNILHWRSFLHFLTARSGSQRIVPIVAYYVNLASKTGKLVEMIAGYYGQSVNFCS